MSRPDLQFRLQVWLSGEREKAEANAKDENATYTAVYYDGMAEAFRSCFAKVQEMIDIAKGEKDG